MAHDHHAARCLTVDSNQCWLIEGKLVLFFLFALFGLPGVLFMLQQTGFSDDDLVDEFVAYQFKDSNKYDYGITVT